MIERCYVERLIYDKLWTKEAFFFPAVGTQETSQDTGHMFRLDLTKKDFETCFPNTELSVEIQYDDNMPTDIRYKKNINITGYGHRVYEDLVEVKVGAQNQGILSLTGQADSQWLYSRKRPAKCSAVI